MLLTTICNRRSHAILKNQLASWFLTNSTESGNDRAIGNRKVVINCLRVMQLTMAILFVFSLSLSARSVSQTVNFTGKDVPVRLVFDAIQEQTGYYVLANKEALKNIGKITVEAKRMDIHEFLLLLLKGKPYEFDIEARSIFIRSKYKAPLFENPPLRGIVRDAEGYPLAGVNILIKGSGKGAVTDATGRFTLNLNRNDRLIISSVGFVTKEIQVVDYNALIITLEKSLSQLDQVQIIAYGTTTKRLSTSNIGSVKTETIQKQPVANPLLALQGRVPGLIVTQQSGIPGTNVNVQIRGKASMQNGTDPLYVIDGVPFTSRSLPGASFIGSFGSPFNYLNPADIESIEILKDADATSIYGSRAANGAILITTKKGKSGKSRANFDIQNGWGNASRRMDMMNTREYLAMRHEAKKNDNSPISPVDYDINGTWDTTRDVNWQKELIGNTSRFTNIQTSLSGGTAETQFLIGAGFIRETPSIIGNYSDIKGMMKFNIQHSSVNRKFQLQFSGSYLSDRNKLPNFDPTGAAMNLAPNAPPIFHADGTLNWAINSEGRSTFSNPLNILVQKFSSLSANIIGSSTLSYEIVPGLSVKSLFGFNSLITNEKRFSPLEYYDPTGTFRTRSAAYADKQVTTVNIEPQIEYKKNFGFGAVDILLGSTYQETKSDGMVMNGQGFNSDLEMENPRSATTLTISNVTQNKYRYNAGFARVNYVHSGKHILNLTARRDGSSRFGSENRFANFYSVAGAWIFSDERFVKNRWKGFNFGKLRVSYGTTGNDQIGEYSYLSLYTGIPGALPYQNALGLAASGHANPFLQWELTKKFNAGIDLGFWSNRIMLNVDYYQNLSSNQLLSYVLPSQTGFYSVKNNLPATVRNNGLEIALNMSLVRNEIFSWETNFNVTVPKNKLISFPNLENSGYFTSYTLGQPITITKAYTLAGVNAQTGLYEFIDNKGGIVDEPNTFTDRNITINTSSRLFGGWQNTITYRGFELNFLLQFNRQTDMDAFNRFGNIPGYFNINQPASIQDRWRKQGDIARVQRFNSDFSVYSSFSNATNTSAAFTDVSFVSLKNLSLSYTLPLVLAARLKADNATLFVQGQNLLIITKFKGTNPESSNSYNTLPPLTIVTVGVRAGF